MNDSYSYDTPIDFDNDEVGNVPLSLPKTNIVQDSQKQPPRVYDTGKTHGTSAIEDRWILPVQITHYTGTTKTRLESLFDYNVVFKVYYDYIENPATYKVCILDPNHSRKYKYGEIGALQTTTLTFYESYES